MGEEGLLTSGVGSLRLMGHKYESNSLFLRKSYTNSRKQCIRLIFERFCFLGNSAGMQSYIEGHSFNDHANELIKNANAGWTHPLNQLSCSTKWKTRRQHTRIKYTPLANLLFLPLVSGSVEYHRSSCIMFRASHTTIRLCNWSIRHIPDIPA